MKSKDDWNYIDIKTLIKNVIEIKSKLPILQFLKIQKEDLISDNGIEENFADVIYINMQRVNAIKQYEKHCVIFYEQHNVIMAKGNIKDLIEDKK